jgi:hypothetical protein
VCDSGLTDPVGRATPDADTPGTGSSAPTADEVESPSTSLTMGTRCVVPGDALKAHRA